MSRSVSGTRTFSPVAAAIRESLYRHRLLSTRQIHALHMPDATMRWTRQVLRELAMARQVDRVVARGRNPQYLWFLSELGTHSVDAVAGARLGRRAQVTPQGADGDLQAHTLELNDVGVAFVQAARDRSDDCGPLAWQHEVAHPIGIRPGGRGIEQLRADAVLHYVLHSGASAELRTWFVELDRATTSVQELVDKLHRYARFSRYRVDGEPAPAWQALYPLGLPALLMVFSGVKPRRRSKHGHRANQRGYRALAATDHELSLARAALERRIRLVCSIAHAHPDLARLDISCALLDDLVARGPFDGIWQRPGSSGRAPLILDQDQLEDEASNADRRVA